MSLPQEVASSYLTLKGSTVRYAIYPAIDDTDISVTKSFKIMTCGAAKAMDAAEVSLGTMPAVPYWICGVFVHTAVAELMCLRLSNIDGTDVYFEDFLNLTAATVNQGPMILPHPVEMAASALVYGVAGSITGGNTLYCALLCATGL